MLINMKDEDVQVMKSHVEQALLREHNMQKALEEQRQISDLLREQVAREKQQADEAKLMVEQRDQNVVGLRAIAEQERVQVKRLDNELRNEKGLVAQLRESMSDQGRRLRQREEDLESLEVALNDLKASMITEMEIKTREY
jgi:flagellar motor protein MotB